MPIEILMPALSPTMSEGTLARWLKEEGDQVKSGDVLAEIETDKATMEFESVDDGVMGKILVPGGTAGVKVSQPIAILLQEGEESGSLADLGPISQPEAAAPVVAGTLLPAVGATVRILASPLARRIAAESGLDLKGLTGSGPHGRIVKADVEKAINSGVARAALSPAALFARAGL